MEQVITEVLSALYSHDLFYQLFHLKGGQALRLGSQIKDRFSKDIDFSIEYEIKEKDPFFSTLKEVLETHFLSMGWSVFDFAPVRRPKQPQQNLIGWGGWCVEFKLIDKNKMHLSLEDLQRQALVPKGSDSSKIVIDISENEYCGAVETVMINTVNIKIYSRALLILEKIRAICQQHPDYAHRKIFKNRARDYYDIERLYQKCLQENRVEEWSQQACEHIKKVFQAKDVPLDLLNKIFEPTFVENQRRSWPSVQSTVAGKLQDFDYYNETLKNIIDDLQQKFRKP